MSTPNESIKKINFLFCEVSGLYHKLNAKLGLSDSVSNILYTICNFGGSCPISSICIYLGIPKQTVNSALRLLERDGIVYLRSCGPRAKEAVLTQRGREFCDSTIARIFSAEKAALAAFTPEEYAEFIRLNEKYNDSLRRHIDDGEE